jgi:acyl carrier protein
LGALAMTTRQIILSTIETVAREQKKPLAPLSDDLPLLESGLDSLGFAILVARLEDATGCDPFATCGDAAFPNTIGELIAFYDGALAKAA